MIHQWMWSLNHVTRSNQARRTRISTAVWSFESFILLHDYKSLGGSSIDFDRIVLVHSPSLVSFQRLLGTAHLWWVLSRSGNRDAAKQELTEVQADVGCIQRNLHVKIESAEQNQITQKLKLAFNALKHQGFGCWAGCFIIFISDLAAEDPAWINEVSKNAFLHHFAMSNINDIDVCSMVFPRFFLAKEN